MSTVANNLVKKGITLVRQLDPLKPTSGQLQQRCLLGLLRRAGQTDFGRHYDFESAAMAADPIAAFQDRVPMHSYDRMFDQWWNRTLAGEADVSWRGKTPYFALSSGTSGAASKYIPVTADMQRSMRQAAFRMFTCLPKYNLSASFYAKEWLMIGGSASLQDLGHCYAGDLSGINARKPPVWIRRYYRPGTRIARISNWDERTDAIARMAPKWDVGVLTGIPSWVQLTLERVIEYHGLNNIHEIWPNLQVFVSGGVAFEPYRKSFEALLAHPLIYQDSYLASEGFIAFQARPDTSSMRLLLNNGIFYEFVPFNEDNFDEEGQLRPQATALTIDEVEEGVDYALLWGLLAWFMGYIPSIGFLIALFPPLILAYAKFGLSTAVVVLVGYVVINGGVQNLVQPKIMGQGLRINPLVVFVGLFVWGYLLGGIGALLAVPLTLLILTLMENFAATRVPAVLMRYSGEDPKEEQQEALRHVKTLWGKVRANLMPAKGQEEEGSRAGEDRG